MQHKELVGRWERMLGERRHLECDATLVASRCSMLLERQALYSQRNKLTKAYALSLALRAQPTPPTRYTQQRKALGAPAYPASDSAGALSPACI